MEEAKCPCPTLKRLEGASVPAYIAAYLEKAGEAEDKNLYRCRVCGREWERLAAEGKRPSLIRQK